MLAKIDDYLLGVFSRISAFIQAKNAQKKKNRSQTPLEDVARGLTKITKFISNTVACAIIILPVVSMILPVILMTGMLLILHIQRNKNYTITTALIFLAANKPNNPKTKIIIEKFRRRSLSSLIFYLISAIMVTIAIRLTLGTNIFAIRSIPDLWLASLIVLPLVTDITNTSAIYIATFISGTTSTSKNPFAKARHSLLPAIS